jgi:putative ABC transport system permease protein
MLKNYFKIAWRNLLRNKLYSLINIIGLAIGVSCCVLIFLYVQYELSYDTYNTKSDRIFRLTTESHEPNKVVSFAPTSPVISVRLQANFPEVERFARLNFSRRAISHGNNKFYDTRIVYADSTMLTMFTFGMKEGDPAKALTAPYSVVLTESAAKRYFGSEPAFGKVMKMSDTIPLMVTGIIKDIPLNSHIGFDCLLSRSTMNDMNKNNPDWIEGNEKNWFNCDSYSYVLLSENTNYKQFEPKINKMLEKEMEDVRKATGMSMNIRLQPLKDIHLRSHLDAEFRGSNNSDIVYVYIFSGTAFLILLIACCNFINLSTARSINRSKEIGLRKVIGAKRAQLVAQFLGESILFSLIASLLSLLIVVSAIPVFNAFIGVPLSLNGSVFWIYLAIIAAVGILAGLYPALLMSSFTPIRSLKGKVTHGLADIFFRKGLVVFQFAIAVMLIVGSSLILQQLDFIQNRNIGMNKEQVMGIELRGADQRKGQVILKELAKDPHVTNATLNGFSFKQMSHITLLPEGTPENELTSSDVFAVDENFLKTFQIGIAAGRDFSKDFPNDVNDAFIVNETAVKAFGWKTPKAALGKKIQWGGNKEGSVIGVVKDFNYTSLREDIQPLLIHIFPPWYNTVTLRLKTTDLSKTLRNIETTWKAVTTESPFKYAFVEDDFNSLYRSEQNMRSVLGAFTFLSVFVACLGLFGLAAFTIKQRFREIGIRKVLGSSVSGIVSLLSRDFLKLVLVSILIACPLAWYAMHTWLQDFAYKVEIGWWVFLLAGSMALLVAFATVCFQAMKAAWANPVKSLRTE